MSARVLESFSRAAPLYREHAVVQAALGAWVSEWLPVVRSGTALEVGAGPGLFTEQILDWPDGLTVTDISPAMCAAGRRAMPEAVWRVMAAETPLAGPWTWIFSSGMLQWVSEPERVFSAWRSCLVPGGRMLTGLFVAESLPELREVSGGCDPLVWRLPGEWHAALVAAGLRVVRDEAQRRTFMYSSARDFLRTLHGVGAAPVRRFTPGRLRRLIEDYDARFGSPDGVPATWTFYRFEAERA